MSNSNTIFIIHAKDADQHLGKLQEILEDLKSENRIDSYSTLKSNSVEENSFQDLGPGDMVILLLTHELEPDRAFIEKILFNARDKQPDSKVAEVIIDNIPYEPKFIAFPPDLEPIRARENMDAAWNETKNSLKDFFPSREGPEPATPWKKFLPYIIGVIALILLIYFLWPNGNDGNNGYKVTDLTASVVGSNEYSGNCPHKFEFTSKITTNGAGVVKYIWYRSDNAKGPENTLMFDEAGTKEVKTTWTLGADGENYENFWQKLKVLGPNELESNEANFTLNCNEAVQPDTGTGDGFNVIDVTASVIGSNQFSGNCPHQFQFTSEITANGAGEVKYTWLRSDNARGPENILIFEEAGTKEVNTTWTLGASGANYEGFWQKLRVLAPNEVESNEASFTLNCEQ